MLVKGATGSKPLSHKDILYRFEKYYTRVSYKFLQATLQSFQLFLLVILKETEVYYKKNTASL